MPVPERESCEDRQIARAMAHAMAEAVERGDVDAFERLVTPDEALNIDWRLAFRLIGKLGTVTPIFS